MCKFGCDDLFEKGYISVKDGRFIQLPKRPITEELEAYTKAKTYLQSCSYREVASWLTATTGRKISPQGLRKKVLGEKIVVFSFE